MRAEDFGYRPDKHSTDNFRRSTMMSVLAHGLFAPIFSRSTGMLARIVADDNDSSLSLNLIISQVLVVSKRQKRRLRGKRKHRSSGVK